MIRLGSSSFEGSNACVLMPSPSSTNTLLRLFSLLPMIKYAVTAFLPSFVRPITIPLPGYVVLDNSFANDTLSMSSSMFSDNVVCIPKTFWACRNKKDRLNTHINIKLCMKLILNVRPDGRQSTVILHVVIHFRQSYNCLYLSMYFCHCQVSL